MDRGKELFQSEADFKYFGTILRNENCIHEDIKIRLYFRNAYSNAAQELYLSVF
jgi:hypothetical protein